MAPTLTNAHVTAATARLRERIGPTQAVRVVQRGPDLVVEATDGSDFEKVVPDPQPSATVAASAAPAAASASTSTAAPAATTATPMGEAGYDRLLELLNNPPIDVPGLPPPGTGIPTDLKDWLEAFKEPLVYMTVDAAMSAVKAKLGGYSRGRLKELYRALSPADLAAVMQGNAAIIKKFRDQKAAEAAMIESISAKVTEASAGLLFKLLAFV